MKIIIAAIFIASFTATTQAQEEQARCKVAEAYARLVMISRQRGMPMRDLVEASQSNKRQDRYKEFFTVELIASAYDVPLHTASPTISDYVADLRREDAITEFGSQAYKRCIRK